MNVGLTFVVKSKTVLTYIPEYASGRYGAVGLAGIAVVGAAVVNYATVLNDLYFTHALYAVS